MWEEIERREMRVERLEKESVPTMEAVKRTIEAGFGRKRRS